MFKSKDPGRLGATLAFASRLLLQWSKEQQQPFYLEWERKKQERQGEQKDTISLGELRQDRLVCFLNMCGSSRAGLQAVGLVQGKTQRSHVQIEQLTRFGSCGRDGA